MAGEPVTYYKVLNEDGTPFHGGTGAWHLPTTRKPGKWMPTIADPEPCRRGYHGCRGEAQLLHWLGPVIYTMEYRGIVLDAEDKVVGGRARLLRRCAHWNERTARLFAAAAARDVLHLYKRAAAWDAERAAARDAAWAAARAKQARRLAHLLTTGEIIQDV